MSTFSAYVFAAWYIVTIFWLLWIISVLDAVGLITITQPTKHSARRSEDTDR